MGLHWTVPPAQGSVFSTAAQRSTHRAWKGRQKPVMGQLVCLKPCTEGGPRSAVQNALTLASKGSMTIEPSIHTTRSGQHVVVQRKVFRCWDHGCGGIQFSTLSNYRRHCREKSMPVDETALCPLCGKSFKRTAARDAHLARQRCLGSMEDQLKHLEIGIAQAPDLSSSTYSPQPLDQDWEAAVDQAQQSILTPGSRIHGDMLTVQRIGWRSTPAFHA